MPFSRFLTILRTGLLACLLAGPVLAGPAAAFEVPYKDFYDELKRFEPRPGTERLALRSSLRAKDRDTELGPVEMRILTADGPQTVPVDKENAFTLPMNPAWVEEGARIELNQDPERFEIRVQVGMKLDDPTRFSYADVVAAFGQFDAVIGKEAGFFAFAVPSAKVLRVQCGVGCTATLAGPKGESTIAADDRGRVNIPKERRLLKENPTITLSRPALWTSISTKDTGTRD